MSVSSAGSSSISRSNSTEGGSKSSVVGTPSEDNKAADVSKGYFDGLKSDTYRAFITLTGGLTSVAAGASQAVDAYKGTTENSDGQKTPSPSGSHSDFSVVDGLENKGSTPLVSGVNPSREGTSSPTIPVSASKWNEVQAKVAFLMENRVTANEALQFAKLSDLDQKTKEIEDQVKAAITNGIASLTAEVQSGYVSKQAHEERLASLATNDQVKAAITEGITHLATTEYVANQIASAKLESVTCNSTHSAPDNRDMGERRKSLGETVLGGLAGGKKDKVKKGNSGSAEGTA